MPVSQETDWLGQVVSLLPDAIVMDYKPATEHGWELMQMITQNPETCDIPVVFYSLPAEARMGSVLEMDYLTKPIGSPQLSQTLERLVLKTKTSRRPSWSSTMTPGCWRCTYACSKTR